MIVWFDNIVEELELRLGDRMLDGDFCVCKSRDLPLGRQLPNFHLLLHSIGDDDIEQLVVVSVAPTVACVGLGHQNPGLWQL
jgi:hypothetical protein